MKWLDVTRESVRKCFQLCRDLIEGQPSSVEEIYFALYPLRTCLDLCGVLAGSRPDDRQSLLHANNRLLLEVPLAANALLIVRQIKADHVSELLRHPYAAHRFARATMARPDRSDMDLLVNVAMQNPWVFALPLCDSSSVLLPAVHARALLSCWIWLGTRESPFAIEFARTFAAQICRPVTPSGMLPYALALLGEDCFTPATPDSLARAMGYLMCTGPAQCNMYDAGDPLADRLLSIALCCVQCRPPPPPLSLRAVLLLLAAALRHAPVPSAPAQIPADSVPLLAGVLELVACCTEWPGDPDASEVLQWLHMLITTYLRLFFSSQPLLDKITSTLKHHRQQSEFLWNLFSALMSISRGIPAQYGAALQAATAMLGDQSEGLPPWAALDLTRAVPAGCIGVLGVVLQDMCDLEVRQWFCILFFSVLIFIIIIIFSFAAAAGVLFHPYTFRLWMQCVAAVSSLLVI